MAQPSDTVSLRITLRYKDLDEFVNRYAENISSAGLFLRTKSPKATGTKIRFELLLADGSRALRGEGIVVTVREDDKPGMALRFKMLDADSQSVIDRIVAKHGQGTLAPTPLSTNLGRPAYGGAAARPTSTPNWRASSGWVSMSSGPRVPGQSDRPGSGSGVLPRRASRTFDGQPKKPIPREPSGSHSIPREALPRRRSSVTRPWGSGERETTGRIRVSDFASAREDTGSLSRPKLPPIGDAPTVEDDRTLRMDVERLPSNRGDTTLDARRGVGEAHVASDEFLPDIESNALFARTPSHMPSTTDDVLLQEEDVVSAEAPDTLEDEASESEDEVAVAAAESALHFGLDALEDATGPTTEPTNAPIDEPDEAPEAEALPPARVENDPWADALGIPPTQPPGPAHAWSDSTDETSSDEEASFGDESTDADVDTRAEHEVSQDVEVMDGDGVDVTAASNDEEANADAIANDEDERGAHVAAKSEHRDGGAPTLEDFGADRAANDADEDEPNAEARAANDADEALDADDARDGEDGSAERDVEDQASDAYAARDHEDDAYPARGDDDAHDASDGAREDDEAPDPHASDDADDADAAREDDDVPDLHASDDADDADGAREDDDVPDAHASDDADDAHASDDADGAYGAREADERDADGAHEADDVPDAHGSDDAYDARAAEDAAAVDDDAVAARGDEADTPTSEPELAARDSAHEADASLTDASDDEDDALAASDDEHAPEEHASDADATREADVDGAYGQLDDPTHAEVAAWRADGEPSVLGAADPSALDAPRDTEANAHPALDDVVEPAAHDPTRAEVRAYGEPADDPAAGEVDEFETSFAEVGDEIRRQVAEEDAADDDDDDPTGHIPYPADREASAPNTEEMSSPLRGADAFEDEPTAHILSASQERVDPSVVDPAAVPHERTDRTAPPAEMDDEQTVHAQQSAAPDEAMEDGPTVHAAAEMDDAPTRFDTRQEAPRPEASESPDFSDGEQTAALAAHPIPGSAHDDDEAETKVRVSSVDESDAVVPIPEVSMDEEATRLERPEDPARAYDEAPTHAEIQREPPGARPAEPYAEAATVHAPETQVVRTRKPRAEDPSRVSLDASTEIVKAHDATAPRDGTPMYSTEVQVTGVASDAPPHEEVAPTRPRPKSYRPAIERESSRSKNPEDMLRRAREAAFSEEATEVPPERSTDDQVAKRPAVEQPRRAAPATQRIRARGPQAPSRAQRVVGIDFGGQWVRMGLLVGADLDLIPVAASAYIPALVATRKDGSLVTGVKARALVLDDPRRGTSPRAVLQAIENGRVPPGRADALNVIGSSDGEVKLRLGDHVVDLADVLVTYFAFLRDAIELHLSTDTFSVAMLVPDDLDASAKKMIEDACKTARLDIASLVPESQAMLTAYNLHEHPVSAALLIDVGMTHVGIRVAKRTESGFEIVASRWDDKLSAGTFDDRVVQLTLDELEAQAGENHQADRTARLRLKEAVEHARLDIRRAASVELKVTLPAPGGASGVVVERSIKLPRSRIYQVTEDVVLEICVAVQDVLREAGIDPRKVDTTILAGSGGTFPPLVEALMNLTQQEPQHSIPPAHVFAMGLAKSGASIERAEVASQPNTLSASIGFGLPGGRFRPILQAGTKLPVSISKSYPTTKDGQTDVELKFYQGDAEFVRTCTLLGELTLAGLPRAIRGEVRIDLDLAVAADGVLSIRLAEKTNNVQERLTVATVQTPNERRRSLAARRPAPTPEPPQKGGGFFKRLFGRK